MAANQVRRNGAFAPLSAHYYEDDAIAEVEPMAELLFVRGIAFCTRVLSDGFITDRQLARFVGPDLGDVRQLAAQLVEMNLWIRADGGYVVRTWLKWNRSSAEITRNRAKDAARKRGDEVTSGDDEEPDPPNPPNDGCEPGPTSSDTSPAPSPNGFRAESERSPNGGGGGIQPPHTHTHTSPSPAPAPAQTEVLPLGVLAPRDKLDLFPEFWSAYPRKVDKADARKMWDRAIKNGVDPDRIVSSARRFAAATAGKPKKYFKYPATWINKGCYDNDLDEVYPVESQQLAPPDQNLANWQSLKPQRLQSVPAMWELEGGTAS